MPVERSVLFVTPYYPPHLGGVERYVEGLARAVRARPGWSTAVVTTGEPGTRPSLSVADGVRVYRLPRDGRISNTPFGLRWPGQLARVIEREAPSVVNAHAPVPGFADLAARLTRHVPFVLTYHTGPLRKDGVVGDLAARGYERWVLPSTLGRAAAIVTSSDYVRRALPTRFRETAVTIHPGVDLTRFTPAPPVSGRAIFAASLDASAAYKNLPMVLRALRLLAGRGEPVELTVAGDGDLRDTYERLTAELGLSRYVEFTGALDTGTLAEAYRKSGFVVLPTSFESFGSVLAEAMACGRPVIASAIGGIPELVRSGEHGLLVSPGDEAGLAGAIGSLAADPGRRAQFGAAARRHVEDRFGLDRQVERTLEVFDRVTDGCATTGTAGSRTGRSHGRPAGAGVRSGGARIARSRAGSGSTTVSSAPVFSPSADDPGTSVTSRRTVLLVTPYYLPHVGGVETYVHGLARALQAEPGWRAVVVTTGPSRRTTTASEAGIRVHRVPVLGKVSYTPLHPWWPVQLRRIIRAERPDVVNVHTPVPGLADVAALAAGRIPLVVTYHAASLEKPGQGLFNLLAGAYSLVERRMMGRARLVLGVSQYVATGLRQRYGGKVGVLENAVDETAVRGPFAADTGYSAAFLARLDPTHAWKGLDQLLHAVSLHRLEHGPGFRLLVIGDGASRPGYEKLAAELGIRDAVTFAGALTGEQKFAALRRCRSLVACPTSANDAFPTVLLEAWACGLPVVATATAPVAALVDDGETGLLVPPGRPADLAAALHRLDTDPALATRLAGRAIEKVREGYTWPIRARQFTRLLEEVANAAPTAQLGDETW